MVEDGAISVGLNSEFMFLKVVQYIIFIARIFSSFLDIRISIFIYLYIRCSLHVKGCEFPVRLEEPVIVGFFSSSPTVLL